MELLGLAGTKVTPPGDGEVGDGGGDIDDDDDEEEEEEKDPKLCLSSRQS